MLNITGLNTPGRSLTSYHSPESLILRFKDLLGVDQHGLGPRKMGIQ